MPSPLSKFVKTADALDVDKTIMSTDFVEGTVDKLEGVGKNIGEAVINWVKPDDKKAPPKPSGVTPTYSESVLEPKNTSTLYDVTNYHDKLPVVEKKSGLISKLNYRVQGFNVLASVKNKTSQVGMILGEKVGASWIKRQGDAVSELRGTVKVSDGRANVTYSEDNPYQGYEVSVFHNNGNSGVSGAYRNYEKGYNTVFAADENSASASFGMNKKCKDCNLEVNAFATTGDNYKNPVVGVSGRITF